MSDSIRTIFFGILGILFLLLIGFIFSKHKRSLNFRTIGAALAIQILIGFFIIYVPAGRDALLYLAKGVNSALEFANRGIDFLFGGLRDFSKIGFVFALYVLPTIIFFSSLISVLYHIGIMNIVIKSIGGLLRLLLGTSRAESLSAAANIFVGQTEAPLVVKPYIKDMSESELFAVMTGGLASIAGSVLVGYSQMGVPLPYLIAASFMSAPGGLLFAKLIIPETDKKAIDKPILKLKDVDPEAPSNVIEAAAVGASTGLQLALNVGAMLLAFISLIALLNGILISVGEFLGIESLTIEYILGIIFKPLAFIIGVPWSDAGYAGSLIGQKLVINEFFAYSQLEPLIKDKVLSPNTIAIVSFALAGFANFSSIAILVGGLGVMAPNRRKDVARLGLRAVLAGALSNLMSAVIAGVFIGLSGPLL